MLLVTKAHVDKLFRTAQLELGKVPFIAVAAMVRLVKVDGSAGNVPLSPNMVCKLNV